MAVEIKVDATQLRRLRQWISQLNPLQAMPAIAVAGESVTRRRIQAGGPAPDGAPWKKLNPTYAASKHGNQGILKRDGYLLASITSGNTATTAFWGSGLIYARVHQFGATIKPKTAGGLLSFLLGNRRVFAHSVTIPARPFLGFGAEEHEAAIDALSDWLNQSVRGGAPAAGS